LEERISPLADELEELDKESDQGSHDSESRSNGAAEDE
jgi:pre-mRNA-splicing factor 38A